MADRDHTASIPKMPPTVSCPPGPFPLPFLSDQIPAETVHCPHRFMAGDHPPLLCLGPSPMPQLWGAQSKQGKGLKISQTSYSPPPSLDIRNESSPLKLRDSAKESLKLSPSGQDVGLPGAPGILLSLSAFPEVMATDGNTPQRGSHPPHNYCHQAQGLPICRGKGGSCPQTPLWFTHVSVSDRISQKSANPPSYNSGLHLFTGIEPPAR